jgi:tetratricopeptide (TPR) repeat protein
VGSIFFICALILVGAILYGPFLKGPFLWDDEHLILHNSFLRGWQHLPEIFSKDIGAGAGRTYNFWRPLQIFSYLVDYSFWGLNSFGYHVTSVFLHISSALVLFWLLRIILSDAAPAGVAALLFLAHPAHTEAVSYISGRSDSLAFLFMMLAFVFYLKDRFWPMTVSFCLALMSREAAIFLPLLVALTHGVTGKPFRRRGFTALLVLVSLMALLRLTALKFIWPDEPLGRFVLAARLPGAFAAFADYLKILVWPLGLHMEYGNALSSWADMKVIAGIFALCSLVLAGLRKNTPIALKFGLWWFLVALAPVLNIFVPLDATMAEHWLYVPSVGFFVMAGFGLVSLEKKRPLFGKTLIAAFVVFFGALTMVQNRFWMDPRLLFERVLRLSPQSNRAQVSLALAYKDAGKLVAAEELLIEALKQKPGDYLAYNILGSVYYQLGEKEKACSAWQNGMEVEPRFCEFYGNLGVLAAEKKKYKEAGSLFREALRRNPLYADAYKNLAIACYNEGRHDEALENWDKARQLGMREDRVVADAFEQLRQKTR